MSKPAGQKTSRLGSEKKIDLRAIVIPTDVWQPQQRCDRKSADKEGKVVGFIRVPPDLNLRNLREEVPKQLDEKALPLEYVFLRCVGDFLTVVSKKQEATLKAKSYAPPYTSTPDMYVLSSDCVDPQLLSSLASTSRTSLTSPLTSPTSATALQLGKETLPEHSPINQATPSLSQSTSPMQPSQLFPMSTTQSLSSAGRSEELLGRSVDEMSSLSAPTAHSYGVSHSPIPQLSISLSPSPLPHPPSESRDPNLPRSPRLERLRLDRSRSSSPQPLAQPTAAGQIFFDQQAVPATLSQHQPAYTGSSLSTSPLPPLSGYGAVGAGSIDSSSEFIPTDQYPVHQHQVPGAGGDAYAGMPIQLQLNQGSNDISVQLGGQQPLLPAGVGSNSPSLPRLDIRIGATSPFRSQPVLPPLGAQDQPAELQGPNENDSGVEPDTSPTSISASLGSRDVFVARESVMKAQQEEAELLRAQLDEMRRIRETMEKRKKDLMDESKELDKEGQRQKQTSDEEWKKRYLQEKRRTVPIENELDDLRKKFSSLHSKPAQQRGRRAMKDAGKVAASDAFNNRTVAKRLEKEIEGLRTRVENLRVQLDKEQAARNQMAQECKQLRDELTDKKITQTLVKKP